MPLYKRGDIWWYDFTVNGERFRGSSRQTNKAAAKRVEDRERERAALGVVRQPVVLTVEQAAARWFRARAEGRKSVVTIAQRLKIALRHIGPDTLVSEIGTADIEAAVQARRLETTRQGKAPSAATVNRDIIETTLRPVLNYAAEVLEQPVKRIAWGKVRLPEPKGRTRTFTASEIDAWRAALPMWHRPVFDFLRRYGLRLKEVFFHPDAFDAIAGEVTIRNRKNGVDLTIPLLDDDVRDLAARATRARAAELPTLWYRETKHGLAPIHWRGFQSASKKALGAAGVTDARPAHDLRHQAATTLRRSGDVTLVQMLLGHEDIASTRRYAHADKSDLLKALRHAYDTEARPEPKTPDNSKTGTDT